MTKIKVHILSLGCPKNLVDAELMAAALSRDGFEITTVPEAAEVILVNTCAFILPAREESIEEVLRMASFKKDGVGVCRYLVVAGCLPQRYGRELARELPEVDLFLGTSAVPHVALRLQELVARKKDVARHLIGKPTFLMDARHERILATPSHFAYLKIAEGCSNRCAYCIIPDIRGRARSRKPDDILEEAETLVGRGVKEIILIAQDTTAYGADLKNRPSLPELLRDLAAIPALQWIRLLYTYPARLTERLFETMAQEEKICPYIDMPIQHADDDILRAMNRRGDRRQMEWAIEKARAIIPDIALRTSVIVGFPGETPARYNRLLEFVCEARFDHLGAFIYSREEGTTAAARRSRISSSEKNRRRDLIMEEQAVISYGINRGLVGSRQEVLVEGVSDVADYSHVGRCRRQAPDIDGVTYVAGTDLTVGTIIPCLITDATEYDLFAVPL